MNSSNKRKHDAPRPLTKYEIARILSTRAEQLARGAVTTVPLYVKENRLDTHSAIALAELALGRIPLLIVRPFPDGKNETVRVIGQIGDRMYKTQRVSST
jgi:DNA-directed RNA polymerase subunit K/omega